jgi:hypothetical protein
VTIKRWSLEYACAAETMEEIEMVECTSSVRCTFKTPGVKEAVLDSRDKFHSIKEIFGGIISQYCRLGTVQFQINIADLKRFLSDSLSDIPMKRNCNDSF